MQLMEKCKYKFQEKDKFNGMPYCKFFNEYCEDVSFICDKNCAVFEQYKKIAKLENLLKMCEQHNKNIVKQNQSLQTEVRNFRCALVKIREINIECEGCNGDCTFCASGTNSETYEIAKKALSDEVAIL